MDPFTFKPPGYNSLFLSFLFLCPFTFAASDSSPCDLSPLKETDVCNFSLSIEERASCLVKFLSVEEKSSMLTTSQPAIKRANIPPIQWWTEALHGVGYQWQPDSLPIATVFPMVITTAASFNRTLYKAIANAVSTEGRAAANMGQAGTTFWAPNANIIREPRWGRSSETAGEDPVHAGIYSAIYVKGLQEGEEDKTRLKSSACCKHYYGFDGVAQSTAWGYYGLDYNMSARDESDSYLPMFDACVVEGNASGIMCSYNSVNGTPSCANSRIMTSIAREAWGFNGYITSDCSAVSQVVSIHHYTTPEKVAAATLGSGMDINCGDWKFAPLNISLAKGELKEEVIDRAVHHLVKVQLRLGLFDPPSDQPYRKLGPDNLNSKANVDLALKAAQEGIVLLQNKKGNFPIDPSNYKKGVAVLGPNANHPQALLGGYHGRPPFIVTPLVGLAVVPAFYTPACFNGDTACVNLTYEFEEYAGYADAIVLVVGIRESNWNNMSQAQETEGKDRTTIALPGKQEELISRVCAIAKHNNTPVMVVYMNGGTVDMKSGVECGDGVMWVGYPGMQGGQAIADVIYGTVNPSGRLPMTAYDMSYDSSSTTDMGFRPNPKENNPGRTYRFYTGTPTFPFGAGISYTTFSYTLVDDLGKEGKRAEATAALVASYADVAAGCADAIARKIYGKRSGLPQLLNVTVKVANTGARQGQDSILVFVKPPGAGKNGRPIKSLADFEKVDLKAKESTKVTFGLTWYDMSLADENGKWFTEKGVWQLCFGYDDKLCVSFLIQ